MNFLFQDSLEIFHAGSAQKFSIKVRLKVFRQGPAFFSSQCPITNFPAWVCLISPGLTLRDRCEGTGLKLRNTGRGSTHARTKGRKGIGENRNYHR